MHCGDKAHYRLNNAAVYLQECQECDRVVVDEVL
jgi:hypothetical protein